MPYVRTRRYVLCGRVRASGCSLHSKWVYCWGLRATTRQRIDHVGLNFELIPEFLFILLVKPLLRNLRGEDVGPEVKWSREQPVLISARQLYLLYYLLCILTDHSPTLFFLLPFPSNHILSYAYWSHNYRRRRSHRLSHELDQSCSKKWGLMIFITIPFWEHFLLTAG